jgi:crossover junction endodeoxyribonuclease RuvC
MRVLGIDPGTLVAGYGVVEQAADRPQQAALICVAAGQVSGGRNQPLSVRLRVIFQEFTTLIERHHPDCVAVEEPFVDKNIQTALKLGQAEGVALLAAELAGLPSVVYTPSTIKLALTGYGRAEKFQIGLMTARLLCLNEPPKSHHAADALAVAICHLHSIGPSKVQRPTAMTVPMTEAMKRPMGTHRRLGGRGQRSTLHALMRRGPRGQRGHHGGSGRGDIANSTATLLGNLLKDPQRRMGPHIPHIPL